MTSSLKEAVLKQAEAMAFQAGYDFLYEEEPVVLAQIVKRDDSGSIEDTPLSFQLDVQEEKGTGRVIFYNPSGEFERKSFTIEQPETLMAVFTVIHDSLERH